MHCVRAHDATIPILPYVAWIWRRKCDTTVAQPAPSEEAHGYYVSTLVNVHVVGRETTMLIKAILCKEVKDNPTPLAIAVLCRCRRLLSLSLLHRLPLLLILHFPAALRMLPSDPAPPCCRMRNMATAPATTKEWACSFMRAEMGLCT